MSNKLLILHYSDDAAVYGSFDVSATLESLRRVIEESGFNVLHAFEGASALWHLTIQHPDREIPRELMFDTEAGILHLEFLNDVICYAALCRWVRGVVPEHLPIHFICDSGSPFFEIDFDNLEEQLLAEVPL